MIEAGAIMLGMLVGLCIHGKANAANLPRVSEVQGDQWPLRLVHPRHTQVSIVDLEFLKERVRLQENEIERLMRVARGEVLPEKEVSITRTRLRTAWLSARDKSASSLFGGEDLFSVLERELGLTREETA